MSKECWWEIKISLLNKEWEQNRQFFGASLLFWNMIHIEKRDGVKFGGWFSHAVQLKFKGGVILPLGTAIFHLQSFSTFVVVPYSTCFLTLYAHLTYYREWGNYLLDLSLDFNLMLAYAFIFNISWIFTYASLFGKSWNLDLIVDCIVW